MSTIEYGISFTNPYCKEKREENTKVYQATQAIYNRLREEDGWRPFIDETSKSSVVWLQFGVKNGGSYKIRFISSDDDNDVAVRVYSLITVDEDKRPQVMKALNDLNRRFRFIKFVCDDDGDVNVEYDFLVNAENIPASAREMVIRLVKIIDESYPEIMKALWS